MTDIKVPELAESITEGTIAEWLVQKGDFIKRGDPVIELETDKVNVEVNSDYGGVITDIVQAAGADVEVGDIIATIDENAGEKNLESDEQNADQLTNAEIQAEEESAESSQQRRDVDGVIATPAARKFAREKGIDLENIQTTDPYGRIRPEDVADANRTAHDGISQGTESGSADQSSSDVETASADKPVERIKMSRRRQTIAKRLVDVQQQAAMLTTFNEVDMSAIIKLRNERKEAFKEKHGVKLGFMSFFTKAVIGALKDFPLLNAEIQGKEILKKKYYDIGIAVSTEEGLVVPVVREADKLDFAALEKEIADLSQKAIHKNLALEDLQGGTFTITNGGIFGSMLSTPILNAPQVGILGMHNIQKRPVVMSDDSIEVRPMMYLAVSYDHRIVDGKEAVQFLVRIKELLEDPYNLLLEG